MPARAATVVLLVMCATGLAAIGRWGRTNSASLAPTYLPEEDRERREAVVRRGGAACYLGAAAMALVAVLAMI